MSLFCLTFRSLSLSPGQPIPDHNVVSRSVEDASSIGGGGAEGDVALMRRERDHFFRSLKRSPSQAVAMAPAVKMRSGRDHFFRTLRTAAAASNDQTNHFFRALRTPLAADKETANHFFREEENH